MIMRYPQASPRPWRINRTKMSVFATTVNRTFFAKVLTLRETIGFLLKKVGEMYRRGYLNIYQDLPVIRGRRILLGACLISFAQDSISEDEMITTVETFDVDNYNRTLPYISESHHGKNEKSSSEEPPYQTRGRVYSSLESPLTFYLRDLRKSLRKKQQESSSTPLKPLKDESESFTTGSETFITPVSSQCGVLLTTLSSRLSVDGTGFVDAEWELIIDRPNLHMWRRPSCKESVDSSGSNAGAAGLYEYRVCGSFNDISALCFLEVQLNLAYRQLWDKSVVVLESAKSNNAAGSEVIRWVSRFPFPMASREYIYARRWWLTTVGIEQQAFALIVSRTGNMQPSRSVTSANGMLRNGDESRSDCGLVSVRFYVSNMLIRSHGGIDEPGLDFFLIYSDDPQLTFSAEAASRISSTVVPRLLEKLHDAALTLSMMGLPDTVLPVVLHSRQLVPSDDKKYATTKVENTCNHSLSAATTASIDNSSCTPPTESPTSTTSIPARVYRFFFHP